MGIAVDSRGNVYIADSQPVELFEDFTQEEIWPAGNSTIRKIAPTGTVTTVAGTSGIYGSADGTGGGAKFFDPFGVAVDRAGNLYVADTYNNTIRKISASGVVATLAGEPGVSGSADGTGTAGRFSNPYGIAVDSAGNAYVADTNNDTVRRITPGGVVTTFAGAAGIAGSADGASPAARFNQPFGIAVDDLGNVYVADSGNSTIRKITLDGTVTTLAGQAGVYGSADGVGSVARFSTPMGVAVDGAGIVYVADTGNCTIRKVTPAGTVSTLAGLAGVPGDSDGIGSSARFGGRSDADLGINGLAADALGDVYVADSSNGTVRMITQAGVVTTLAGLARWDVSADGVGTGGHFYAPDGVAVDGSGNVYVADPEALTIRKIAPDATVTTLAGTFGVRGTADGVGANALFGGPTGVAVDMAGNVYVADYGDAPSIRKITPGGIVTTLASVIPGLPIGIALDKAGNIYATTNDEVIIKLTPAGALTEFAGTPDQAGGADGIGNQAQFNFPNGIAVDGAGNIYVADTANYTVRKITPAGVVTTLAGMAGVPGNVDGTGSAARFGGSANPTNGPSGIAADLIGNLYVTDVGNHSIRKITPTGEVTTLAGSTYGGADGIGAAVRFADLGGIAVNSMGSIFVADVGPGPDLGSTVRMGVPADAASNPGRLVNLSALAFVAANQKFTVGFVTGGAGTAGNQPLLVRAMGPTLAGFGVQLPLPAPAFEMFNSAGNVIAADLTGWGSNADAITRADSLTGAFPPGHPNSLDAALAADFSAGGYTAQVWGMGNSSGQVLAEIYDANPSYTLSSPRLINGSSLDNLAAQTALTLGFFIGGSVSETVLIRASGPALAAFNLAGLMADPQIKLFSGQNLIAANAGWNGDPQVARAAGLAGAFSFSDTASHDSAIVETLPPGGYTVQVGSLSAGGGTVLVEVYEVP